MELSHHVQTLHVIHPAYTQPPPPNKHTPMGSIILYIILPKTTWLLTIKYKFSCKFKKKILDSFLLTAFKTFLHILYFSNNSVAKLTTPFRMPRNVAEFHMIVLLKLNQPVQGQHPPIMQKASGFLQILKIIITGILKFYIKSCCSKPFKFKGILNCFLELKPCFKISVIIPVKHRSLFL